jgi:hypothetical protein
LATRREVMYISQPKFAIGVAIIVAPDKRVLILERDGTLDFLKKKVHVGGCGRSFFT